MKARNAIQEARTDGAQHCRTSEAVQAQRVSSKDPGERDAVAWPAHRCRPAACRGEPSRAGGRPGRARERPARGRRVSERPAWRASQPSAHPAPFRSRRRCRRVHVPLGRSQPRWRAASREGRADRRSGRPGPRDRFVPDRRAERGERGGMAISSLVKRRREAALPLKTRFSILICVI